MRLYHRGDDACRGPRDSLFALEEGASYFSSSSFVSDPLDARDVFIVARALIIRSMFAAVLGRRRRTSPLSKRMIDSSLITRSPGCGTASTFLHSIAFCPDGE